MTMLVLLWPQAPADTAADDELSWVLSSDQLNVARQGRARPGALPAADSIVAVLPAHALSWQRVVVPKAPAGRLRAALAGLLEERLLDEDGETHFALAPGARAGSPAWIAVGAKAALAQRLAAWSTAGLHLDRLVAAAAPGGEPSAHVYGLDTGAEAGQLRLGLADREGACSIPLEGGLARARLAEFQARHGGAARLTATPAAAAAAERWAGAPVTVRAEAEQALAAARSGWELRQFDLAPSLRGTRTIGRLARALMEPGWRWARWGLAAALGLQLVGLNLTAWHQQRVLEQHRQAMVELLRTSFPQVRAVLDAPLQMRRETERLRERAGVPADADLEALVAVAGSAWPQGVAPATALHYEPGRLTLAAPGWPPAQVAQMRERLRGAGWQAEYADNQVVITKAESAAALPTGAATAREGAS